MTSTPITIMRGAHTSHFTTLPNDLLQNKAGLSCQARAILFDLLSRPPDWRVVIDNLAKTHRIGRDQVYKALGELREAGYATLETLRDASTGRVAGKRWIINECPSRFPENQEIGECAPQLQLQLQSCKSTDFLKSPNFGENRKSGFQDAYKEKIYKQTNDPPTKSTSPPARVREGAGNQLNEENSSSTPPPDRPDKWRRFEAAWPWQAGAESVTAAQRAFGQLSEADQELCAKGAEAFQPPSGKRVSAWAFIAERHWAFTRRRSATGASRNATAGANGRACLRSDGSWWLSPDSPQLQRWHEFERATSVDRRAKGGCLRSSEWPPSRPAMPGSIDRGQHAEA